MSLATMVQHNRLTWAEDAWNGFDEVLAKQSRQGAGA